MSGGEIYFVTDVQNPQVLTELLNKPDAVAHLDDETAERLLLKKKKRSSIKSLFRKSKIAQKKWPTSVDSLRKVVFFSQKLKSHFEVVLDEAGRWELGNQIEEAYVRALKTLRVLPWLQELYLEKLKKEKKLRKKAEKAEKERKRAEKARLKPPLFPKPQKHKSKKKDKLNKPTSIFSKKPKAKAPEPVAVDVDEQSELSAQLNPSEPPAASSSPEVSAHVQTVVSANDLFTNDGCLRSPRQSQQSSLSQRGPTVLVLGTVSEDHRDAFPEGLEMPPRPYGRSPPSPQQSWSTWPPARSRTYAARKREEERARAVANANENDHDHGSEAGGSEAGGASDSNSNSKRSPGLTQSQTLGRQYHRSYNSHELTLKNIVGVGDAVLAWEAQREGAADDQAARLHAARENMKHQVLVEEEHEAAKRIKAEEAAEARRRAQEEEAAMARRREARELLRQRQTEQAALQAEQERLRLIALEQLQAAVAAERAVRAESECDTSSAEAEPQVAYPTTIVRGGANHMRRQQEMLREQQEARRREQERQAVLESLRAQPSWREHVHELAMFGGVADADAEHILEVYNGSLKAAKLHYYQNML